MSTSYEDLEGFSEKLRKVEFRADLEPPQTAWHYTDLEGLNGILTGQRVRLSNPFFLNDPGELQYGIWLVREVLAKLAQDQSISEDFYLEYLKFEAVERIYEPYVFSMCVDGDDLSLWRTYGREGTGFSLGFDVVQLENEIARLGGEEGDPPWAYVNRVIYNPDTQERLIARIAHWIFGQLDHSLAEEDRVVGYQLLHTMLVYFLPLIKQKDYSGEKEVRLVLYGTDIRRPIEFTPGPGFLKPFTTLRIIDTSTVACPISTVNVGPRGQSDLFERSMDVLLRAKELDHHRIQITKSSIQYRG